MKMEIYIDFQVSSKTANINLNSIFNKEGKFHCIGDVSKTGTILDYSQWNLSFTPIETHDINEVASLFFEETYSLRKKIVKYLKKTDSELLIYFVVINYEGVNDYIYLDLSEENIHKFSKFNASISIDGLG